MIIAGVISTLITGVVIVPPVGALSVASIAATVKNDIRITVPVTAGSLQLNSIEPSSVVGTLITPTVGSMAVSGVVPTATHQALITPTIGSLSLTGYIPTTTDYIIPDTGALVLTGNTPIIPNVGLTIPLGSLVLSGITPSIVEGVSVILTPDTGSLVFDSEYPYGFMGGATLNLRGYRVSLDVSNNITPDTASLVITGNLPGVPGSLTIPVVNLSLTEKEPITNLGIVQSVGSASLSSVASSLVRGTVITPSVGSILQQA